MVFEGLQNNLRYSGYEIVIPKDRYGRSIFFAYKKDETAVYSVAVVNYTGNDKIVREDYENMLRAFRSMVMGEADIGLICFRSCAPMKPDWLLILPQAFIRSGLLMCRMKDLWYMRINHPYILIWTE